MVATDVASRGIGMIEIPSPLPNLFLFFFLSYTLATPVSSSSCSTMRDLNGALLSMLVRAVCSYNLVQGLISSLILLPLGSLGACRTYDALLTVRAHLRHQASLSRVAACSTS
jgi:hypothetical protein